MIKHSGRKACPYLEAGLCFSETGEWIKDEGLKEGRGKMRKMISKTKMVAAIFIGFVAFLLLTPKAEALEPRLLWEKTVPFKIDDIKIAGQGGDVILYSQDARQIILYDKNGNKKFHWGPRIDRQPMGVDISDDGSIILYETAWTEDYTEQKKIDIDKYGWDRRIHYSTKKGKGLWNKVIYGTASLSPDGKMVANFPSAGEGKDLTVIDAQGKILWKYTQGVIENLVFSPDSNYVLFSGEDGLHLFDKSGNLLWKKSQVGGPRSVSEGANYITTSGEFSVAEYMANEKMLYKRVYDKQGNAIFEGEAYVSGDGKRLIVVYPDKVSILSLPDKTIIKEYSLKYATFLSYDGRFIVTSGRPTPHFYIIDSMSNETVRLPIEGNHWVAGSIADGKYLVVIVDGKKILYYQVY